jgi:excisionase family DNA binding protein
MKEALTYREAATYLREVAGPLLTPADVGPLLGRHPDTVRLWCRSGKLPSFNPGGGAYLIRRNDVAELVGIPLT